MISVESIRAMPGAGLEADDDPEALAALMLERNWSDGLPVVAPTAERVREMLRFCDRPVDQPVGKVPPRYGEATPLRLAANAVMAGCRPEYFPLVLLADEALCEEPFNLYGVQATTHSCSTLVVVNGPVGREIGMNAGHNAFGPGNRANATIGRAVRMAMWNVGGAVPAAGDMSTYGSPAKYTYCVAENEAANPWQPLSVELGFAADSTTVTVYGAEPPHNVNDHEHGDAEGILRVAADVLRTLGMNTWYLGWKGRKELMLILGPEHAASIAASGWSRADVRKFLYQATSRRRDELALGGMYGMRDWGSDLEALSAPDALIPAVPRPDDILVLVAGGEGKHSAGLPSFGATVSVTRPIG